MWNGEHINRPYKSQEFSPKDPRDLHELYRLMSFKSFPVVDVSCMTLARLGTKYVGKETYVCCPFCMEETQVDSKKWKMAMTESEIKKILHKRKCPFYAGTHPQNIRYTDDMVNKGRESLAELKSRDHIGLCERKSKECRQKARETRNRWKFEQAQMIEMAKAFVRMCPCDSCKQTFQYDNLLIAQTPQLANSPIRPMAEWLKDCMARSERSKLVEIIYSQRHRTSIDRDGCFVETDYPDQFKCTSCDIGYRWRDGDDPDNISSWHAQNAPYCPLLKLKRGTEYIHQQLERLRKCFLHSGFEMDIDGVMTTMEMYTNHPSSELDAIAKMDIEAAYMVYFFENNGFPTDGRSIIEKLEE